MIPLRSYQTIGALKNLFRSTNLPIRPVNLSNSVNRGSSSSSSSTHLFLPFRSCTFSSILPFSNSFSVLNPELQLTHKHPDYHTMHRSPFSFAFAALLGIAGFSVFTEDNDFLQPLNKQPIAFSKPVPPPIFVDIPSYEKQLQQANNYIQLMIDSFRAQYNDSQRRKTNLPEGGQQALEKIRDNIDHFSTIFEKSLQNDPQASYQVAEMLLSGENLPILPKEYIIVKAEEAYRGGFHQAAALLPLIISQLALNSRESESAFNLAQEALKKVFGLESEVHPYILATIGYSLLTGKGTERDVDKGLTYLRKAYQLDPTFIVPHLHESYHLAWEGENNSIRHRALKVIETHAFDHQNIYALWYYIRFLQFGLDPWVTQDPMKLIALTRLGSSQGHPRCMGLLGKVLLNKARQEFSQLTNTSEQTTLNPSTLQDLQKIKSLLAEVLQLFQESMKHGLDPEVLYELGRMYSDGFGVNKSPQEAQQFAQLAAVLGHRQANELLKAINSRSDAPIEHQEYSENK